jgi:hypothetical protein
LAGGSPSAILVGGREEGRGKREEGRGKREEGVLVSARSCGRADVRLNPQANTSARSIQEDGPMIGLLY